MLRRDEVRGRSPVARPTRQLLLTLEVYTDDQGRMSAKVDSDNDLSEHDAAALIAVIADQLDPARDRADEVQAWGAGRRKRV